MEAPDGYIFSKSIHGKGLSEKEKQWLLLENDANVYTNYRDKDGKLLFRLKSCVDTFSYKFRESDPETGKEKEISFQVKEKRIVSYNPSLAQKQKAEIMKMVDKATNYTTYKKMAREDLGDSVKYIKITNTDKNRKNRKPVIEINQAKIDEDLKYAGYNLLVTSELDMEPPAGISHISQPLENRRVLPYHQILSGRPACLCTKKRNNLWAFFNLLP